MGVAADVRLPMPCLWFEGLHVLGWDSVVANMGASLWLEAMAVVAV